MMKLKKLNKNILVKGFLIGFVAVLIFLTYQIFLNQKQGFLIKGPVTPSPTASIAKKTTTITLQTGFSFDISNDWGAKISNQSAENFSGRFFLPGKNQETDFLEIESTTSKKLFKNPLITIEKTEEKEINGLTVSISSGKESFHQSTRLINQAIFQNKSNLLRITSFSDPKNPIGEHFEQLIKSVKLTNKDKTINLNLVKQVKAAEAIAGIDLERFQEIYAMADPLPERITVNDQVYKDGYAKFYFFQGFKGQRLTVVAWEDRTTNPSSFIKSELYDEEGKLLYNRDTRIEYEVPYTGKYYYIVRTFNSQEGGYLLKIFDRDQTENLVYVKYADGSEKQYFPNGSLFFGEAEIALIVQFVNPIEVWGNKVRYFAEPREFEQGLGLITTPIDVYLKSQTYQEWVDSGYPLPEEDLKNKVAVKLTKISSGKVLIEPAAGGLFPKKHQIAILERLIGVYRLFTEGASPMPIPSLTLAPIPTGRITCFQPCQTDADCQVGLGLSCGYHWDENPNKAGRRCRRPQCPTEEDCYCSWEQPPASLNPIKWKINTVSLEADDFYLIADGKKYLGNVNNVDLHSDPGNSTYTTLELIWQEQEREMRLYLYFNANQSDWWSSEIRTYNGQVRSDWIYYKDPGFFFRSNLGEVFTAPEITLRSSQNNNFSGIIYFKNLRLQAFLDWPRLLSCNVLSKGIISVADYHCELQGGIYPCVKVMVSSSIAYQDTSLKFTQENSDGYFISDPLTFSPRTPTIPNRWMWEGVRPANPRYKLEFYVNHTPSFDGEACGDWRSY